MKAMYKNYGNNAVHISSYIALINIKMKNKIKQYKQKLFALSKLKLINIKMIHISTIIEIAYDTDILLSQSIDVI